MLYIFIQITVTRTDEQSLYESILKRFKMIDTQLFDSHIENEVKWKLTLSYTIKTLNGNILKQRAV